MPSSCMRSRPIIISYRGDMDFVTCISHLTVIVSESCGNCIWVFALSEVENVPAAVFHVVCVPRFLRNFLANCCSHMELDVPESKSALSRMHLGVPCFS